MDDDADNAMMYAEQDEIYAQAEQQHPNAFESEPVAEKPATDDLLGALDSLKHITVKKTDEEHTSASTAKQSPSIESDVAINAEGETETTHNSVSEFVPSEKELAEAEDFAEPEPEPEPTSQFAPSAPILPETNPSQMGLGTDNQAQAHSLVPGVTPDNLVAELPNGDTLTHEAQIDEWSNMISHIKPQSFMQVVMMHSAMQRTGNQITLTVEDNQSHLLSDTLHNKIQEAISKHLQQPIELQIKVGVAHNTPMQIKQKIKAFRLRHANQLFESDPDMQKLMNTFNAQVKDGSMQPKP
ncbi:DNA polymerase III subunit gamma/tau C-terminal domain-containing protein [Opacimonas sp. LMIT016]